MYLWILRPIEGLLDDDCPVEGNPWEGFWDRQHGVVVRAVDEAAARALAASTKGDERSVAWLEARWSSCALLPEVGPAEVVLVDFCRG